MPIRQRTVDIVRIVEGVSGRVPIHMDLRVRFDYGTTLPWVRKHDGQTRLIAGPNSMVLRTPVETDRRRALDRCRLRRERGRLACRSSSRGTRPTRNCRTGATPTTSCRTPNRWWHRRGRAQCTYTGEWRDLVMRSLIALKAMIYAPTGGIVAAPTTSLPEWIGGVRNWDYRYCWLRDSVLTLYAFVAGGYRRRGDRVARLAVARRRRRSRRQLQIMYGAAGERRLSEYELDVAAGVRGVARRCASATPRASSSSSTCTARCSLRCSLMRQAVGESERRRVVGFRDRAARLPRGRVAPPRRRHLGGARRPPALHALEGDGLGRRSTVRSTPPSSSACPGPVDRWRADPRRRSTRQVCDEGYDAGHRVVHAGVRVEGSSTRRCSSSRSSASSRPPTSGSWAPSRRSSASCSTTASCCATAATRSADGLPAGRGRVPPVLVLARRQLRACRAASTRRATLFDRLAGAARTTSDCFAEEYDPVAGRQLGNFPQAFTHMGLVQSASNVSSGRIVTVRDRVEAMIRSRPLVAHRIRTCAADGRGACRS